MDRARDRSEPCADAWFEGVLEAVLMPLRSLHGVESVALRFVDSNGEPRD